MQILYKKYIKFKSEILFTNQHSLFENYITMIKIINLKSAITLTCLFNLNNLVFSQSASTENCVVNPYNIYRAAIKYEGGCKNNKAEGNGNLYLKLLLAIQI